MKRLLLFAIMLLGSALACSIIGPQGSVTCEYARFEFASATANVDNTGSNAEQVNIRVFDGAGNTLATDSHSESLGITILTSSTTLWFNAQPQYNPIILEVYSPAGGDLSQEQVWFRYVGSCPGLPEFVSDDYDKIGQVRVTAPGVALYEAPGSVMRDENGQEVWIPNQHAPNPYEDTYDVIRQQEVDGTTWVNIFVGNSLREVWIPVGGPVQVISME